MTTHNPLRLGFDCLTRAEQNQADNDRFEIGYYNVGRDFREYWIVRDYNLNTEEKFDIILQKFAAAYPKVDIEDVKILINSEYFVTDDEFVASEMYRVLKLDFVYDIASGLWFFDMFGGHEVVMGGLHNYVTNNHSLMFSEGAELYIQKGMGVYKSSQSSIIWIGKDVAMPSWLRQFSNKVQVME